MSFKLDPACPVGTELQRIMHEETAGAILVLGRRRTAAKERIHRVRTTAKKLRATLQLLSGAAPKLARRENRRLRDAARELSALRDADAMLDCLAALIEHSSTSVHRMHFDPVRRALLEHRRTSQPAAAKLDGRWREFIAVLRTCDRHFARGLPDLTFGEIAAELRRSYQHARRALREVEAEPSAEAFHEWRKATKVYAYQCRLLRAAWVPAMKELRHELKALASRLGDEHDLNVLDLRLQQMRRGKSLAADEETFQVLADLIEARREELRREAIPLGKRLFADRPSAVEARIMEWWRVASATPAQAVVERTS